MRRLAALSVLLGFVAGPSFGFTGLQHSSYRDGKRYDFALTCEQVVAAPPWTADHPEPPLSARAAVAKARAALAKIFTSSHTWAVQAISLSNTCATDRWYYAVKLAPAEETLDRSMTIPVLMDGTTAEPAISPWKETVIVSPWPPCQPSAATPPISPTSEPIDLGRLALTCEQVAAAPPWPDDAPNPPLTAREAVLKARPAFAARVRARVERGEEEAVGPLESWPAQTISLRVGCGNDHWYYAVEFSLGFFSLGREGFDEISPIPVLLDGTTPQRPEAEGRTRR